MPGSSVASFWERLQALRHRHERAEHVLFFAGGFTFDAVCVEGSLCAPGSPPAAPGGAQRSEKVFRYPR